MSTEIIFGKIVSVVAMVVKLVVGVIVERLITGKSNAKNVIDVHKCGKRVRLSVDFADGKH